MKRLPWYYIIIMITACAVIPYYVSVNSNQKAMLNQVQAGSGENALSNQTLSRLNGLNSTGPKSYDAGKVSSNK